MATEPKRPDLDDDTDEPTEEELEEQKHSQQTWKHDDSRELSERDIEIPLKP
ncbi:hypothetical protein [Pseudomonas mohnii]